MTRWIPFAVFLVLLVVAMLALARSTAATVEPDDESSTAVARRTKEPPDGHGFVPQSDGSTYPGIDERLPLAADRGSGPSPADAETECRRRRRSEDRAPSTGTDRRSVTEVGPPVSGATPEETRPGDSLDRTNSATEAPSLDDLSTETLYLNVALSHGLLMLVLVLAVWLADVPLAALRIGTGPSTVIAISMGLSLGAGLYIANEVAAAVAKHLGVGHSERLRELLAPATAGHWFWLLVGVLPVIAAFEELLFRAALIGAMAAGFGISPWLLVAVSSVAFALGHGVQGTGGILVTGLLGLALGGAFVLTGSLLAVIVAHYTVNVLEFVVHEGIGVEWVADAVNANRY